MLFINCVVHMDTKGKKAFNICMDFRGSGVSYFYFFCFLIAQIHHVASNLVFLPMLHEVNDTFHDAGHRRDSNMIMTIHGHPVHVGKRLRLFISGMHFYFLRKSYGSDSRLFFFFFFYLMQDCFVYQPFLLESVIITYTTQDTHSWIVFCGLWHGRYLGVVVCT